MVLPDFKNENMFFKSALNYAGRILDSSLEIMLSPPK